jgi:hypothetical protein
VIELDNAEPTVPAVRSAAGEVVDVAEAVVVVVVDELVLLEAPPALDVGGVELGGTTGAVVLVGSAPGVLGREVVGDVAEALGAVVDGPVIAGGAGAGPVVAVVVAVVVAGPVGATVVVSVVAGAVDAGSVVVLVESAIVVELVGSKGWSAPGCPAGCGPEASVAAMARPDMLVSTNSEPTAATSARRRPGVTAEPFGRRRSGAVRAAGAGSALDSSGT